LSVVLSPYLLVLSEVEEGKVNPLDVDLARLIALFRETSRNLETSDYLKEAGMFLEAAAKLLKLQVEEFFPETTERKRVTLERVREVLTDESESPDYDTSFLYDYTPRIGRPAGVQNKQGRKPSQGGLPLTAESVPLHREVNYYELARSLREQYLQTGKIEINSLRDFLAYLFAYLEYEDIPDIEREGNFASVGQR